MCASPRAFFMDERAAVYLLYVASAAQESAWLTCSAPHSLTEKEQEEHARRALHVGRSDGFTAAANNARLPKAGRTAKSKHSH